MFNFLDTPRVGIWRVSSEFREGRAHLYQEWSGKCSLQRNLDFEAKKKKKEFFCESEGRYRKVEEWYRRYLHGDRAAQGVFEEQWPA